MIPLRAVFHLLPLFCLALCGCGVHRVETAAGAPGGRYVGGRVPVECAPFARALTGVRLSGAAADWWQQAAGRYERSADPAAGSLLIFRRSSRLPSGHVAVVSELVSPRQILVSQANWVHHRVTEDQSVFDVSAAGDWSVVRVFWPPSGQMGTTDYPVHGFLRPDHPQDHRSLVRHTPDAIRIAQTGW